jgi:hypothetical protein
VGEHRGYDSSTRESESLPSNTKQQPSKIRNPTNWGARFVATLFIVIT